MLEANRYLVRMSPMSYSFCATIDIYAFYIIYVEKRTRNRDEERRKGIAAIASTAPLVVALIAVTLVVGGPLWLQSKEKN